MVIVYFDTKSNNNKEGRFIRSSVVRESGKKGFVQYAMVQLGRRKTNKTKAKTKAKTNTKKKAKTNIGNIDIDNIGKGTPPRAWKKSV